MRKLAREKSLGRTEKVHQRINALEPEEIAFPASISVLRAGEREGRNRARKGTGFSLVKRCRDEDGMTRREGGKGERAFGIFQYTYAARCTLLSFRLSFSLSFFLLLRIVSHNYALEKK